jgi:hypothetical protein
MMDGGRLAGGGRIDPKQSGEGLRLVGDRIAVLMHSTIRSGYL